jgi:hypothetical protein
MLALHLDDAAASAMFEKELKRAVSATSRQFDNAAHIAKHEKAEKKA